MGRKNFATVITIVAGVTGLTFASAAVGADQDGTAAVDKKESKRICKSLIPTGSRFTQRVCKTAEQWQRDADRAQRLVEDSFKELRSPTPAQ